MDLDREFLNLKENGQLTIFGKELIEDTFIVLKKMLRNQVVPPFSGARYFGDPFKVPNSDHSSIAKVEGIGAMQHRLLVKFLEELSENFTDGENIARIDPNLDADDLVLKENGNDNSARNAEPVGKNVQVNFVQGDETDGIVAAPHSQVNVTRNVTKRSD